MKHSCKHIYQKQNGFSLVEIMIATLLAPLIIYGVYDIIIGSREEVNALQEDVDRNESFKRFFLQWSSLTQRAIAARHFQKLPIDIQSPNCIELKESEQGGGCFFKIQAKRSKNYKQQPLCAMDIADRLEILPNAIGINFFYDEDIKTEKTEAADIENTQIQNITIKKNHSKDKYYVGWKVAEEAPFPIITKMKNLDVTFAIPSDINKSPLTDPNELFDEQIYVFQANMTKEIDNISQQQQEEFLKKLEDQIKHKLMIFYVKNHPKTYMLKVAKDIQSCKNPNTTQDCLDQYEKGLDKNNPDNSKKIAKMQTKFLQSTKYFLIELRDSQETLDELTRRTVDYTHWNSIGKDIQWNENPSFYHFPVKKFPIENQTYENFRVSFDNIYDMNRLFFDKKDSEIIGIPVDWMIIHIKTMEHRIPKNHRRNLYYYLFDYNEERDYEEQPRSLINHLQFPYGKKEEEELRRTMQEVKNQKTPIESVIIAREIGTRKLSVFVVDLFENQCPNPNEL